MDLGRDRALDLNNIKLDLKSLIAIGTILITIGGFYYTTKLRLDVLESEIKTLKEKTGSLSKEIQQSAKQNKRLLRRLNQSKKGE